MTFPRKAPESVNRIACPSPLSADEQTTDLVLPDADDVLEINRRCHTEEFQARVLSFKLAFCSPPNGAAFASIS